MRRALTIFVVSLSLAMPYVLTGSGQSPAHGSPPSSSGRPCRLASVPGACVGVHGSRPPGGHEPRDPGSGGSGSGGSDRHTSWLDRHYVACLTAIQLGSLASARDLCPTGHVSTAGLAVQAANRLPIPAPAIRTAPPRGKRELIGIPTWFWPAKSQWAPRSATASAGGVSSTVTATAYELTIDLGDGSDPFTCHAPWTPYHAGRQSTCKQAFTHSGRYTVTATVRWAADWHGSDGNGGTLPTISRTATFPIHVVEARSELIANP